jgi:hypothetical protein
MGTPRATMGGMSEQRGDDPGHEAFDYAPRQVVAETLRRAIEHVDELLVSEVQTEAGDVVLIVCLPEVRGWLRTLASRVELGERLRPVTRE